MSGNVGKQYQKTYQDDRTNNTNPVTKRRARRSEAEIRDLCTEFDKYIVPLPPITLSPYYNIIQQTSRNTGISATPLEQEKLTKASTNSDDCPTEKDSEEYLKELCAEFEKYLEALTEYYAREKSRNLDENQGKDTAAENRLSKIDTLSPFTSTKETPEKSKFTKTINYTVNTLSSDKKCNETFDLSVTLNITERSQQTSSGSQKDFCNTKDEHPSCFKSTGQSHNGETKMRSVTRLEGVRCENTTTSKNPDIPVLPRLPVATTARLPPIKGRSDHNEHRDVSRRSSLVSRTVNKEIQKRSEDRTETNVNPPPNSANKTIKTDRSCLDNTVMDISQKSGGLLKDKRKNIKGKRVHCGSPNATPFKDMQSENVQEDSTTRSNTERADRENASTHRPRVLTPVVKKEANELASFPPKPTGHLPPLQPENLISENTRNKPKDFKASSKIRNDPSSEERRQHPRKTKHVYPWQRRSD